MGNIVFSKSGSSRILSRHAPLRWASSVLAFLILILATGPTLADSLTGVPMTASAWRASTPDAMTFFEHQGRQAIRLDGVAFVEGLELESGTVEVDVTQASARHFANIIFAGYDFENFEGFYLRMHRSGLPDAVQYTPHLNGETNWQLFWREQASATFDAAEWTTLRLEFTPERARLTVQSDQTVLAVEPISNLAGCSRVGVADFFGGIFSRFRYSSEVPELAPAEREPKPEVGIINFWEVSPAFAVGDGGVATLPEDRSDWQELPTDAGLLLISRFRDKRVGGDFERNSEDVVFCRKLIRAESDTRAALDFDFSDRADVYLNGELLYSGNNAFRLKGPLFRGEVALGARRLILPLQAGDNELVVAVADRANGWGLKARLESTTGVAVQ